MAKADNEETPAVEPVEPIAEAEAPAAPGDSKTVSYRVLKAGDGKVHTGRHHRETGEPETFAKGDQVDGVLRSIAEELEDRHYVEILED